MYEKLLALLPYNPGMTHQLAFYSRRMREEASIRRIGLIFMVLAFMIQFFAVISPPQPTVADSSNDLVNGGISSAADAKQKCVDNVRHYKDIMNYYGISCSKVGNAQTVTLKSTDHKGKLFSMGWNPQGQRNNKTGRPTSEQPVNVPGVKNTLYWRLLHSWDSGPSSTYKALRLTNSDGKVFYILYSCGNLVSIGIPKDAFEGIGVVSQPCLYNFNLPANSSKCVAPCQYNPSISANSSKCFKPCQYNASIPASSKDCFDHCPIPGKTNLPKTSPQCFAPCPYNSKISASSAQCFQPCKYNAGIPATSPNCYEVCKYNSSLPANSPQCFQPCQYNNSIPATSSSCKPCDKSISSADTLACVSVHKTASNITTGTTDANGTMAHGGDVITYTLFAQNSGKAAVKNFTFAENMSDVLDYADLTDMHGGTIDSDHVVTWPAQTIAAGATTSHQVTVTIKNPVPQTPVDPSDPAHFDLTMTNVYGNTVNITLPGSPSKTVEVAAASLPNTGPGASLIIAGLTVILAGYFYGRTRLLAKESMIAVQETASA